MSQPKWSDEISGQFQTWLKIKNTCRCEASATIYFDGGGQDFVSRVPALGETEKMIGTCGPNEATWKSVVLECEGGGKSTGTPPNSPPTPRTAAPTQQSSPLPASLQDKIAAIKSMPKELQNRILTCESNNCLRNVQAGNDRCYDLYQHGRTTEASDECMKNNTEDFNGCVGRCMSANR